MNLALFLALCFAQEPGMPVRIGPGVTPPKPIVRMEPEFTHEARQAGYQGIVLLEFVVTMDGMPSEIRVLSPLGFGLDEAAIRTLEKWRFQPGIKDGKAVAVRATLEVNFRLAPGEIFFDPNEERRRTRHNVAIQRLRESSAAREKSIEELAKLAKEKYLPSMILYAEMLRDGKASSTTLRAEDLIEAGAKKKFGPALYWKAFDLIEKANDSTNGLKLMRDAAYRGAPQAQLYLARLHRSGDLGVDKSESEARRYVRLCARRTPECQWMLAEMLANGARPESSAHLEALAWALNASPFVPAAKNWTKAEIPTLAETNQNYVRQLAKQLQP
jgi:TonB family protein